MIFPFLIPIVAIIPPAFTWFGDGTFHMFRNGFEWNEISEEPVLDLEDVDYVTFTALASDALVKDDGSWVLYLYTWDQRLPASAASSKIIRAVAPGPAGPWTADLEPLLLPGSEGEWDSLALRAPSVVLVHDLQQQQQRRRRQRSPWQCV